MGEEEKKIRLAWPPPRHLIVSLLIPLAAMAVVHLSPSSLREELSALALILVFLVPGYLAVLWAYPGKGDLSLRGRTVLSLAASVLLAGLLGLLLAATPRGLQSASLATLLSLFSIFLFAMAYLRWSDLPRNRRFFLLPKKGLRPGPNNSRTYGRSINGRRATYAALLLAVGFIAALALSIGLYHISWGDISSRFQEPLPGLEAGKGERLLTLTKEDRPQLDLEAGVSDQGMVQGPASGQGANSSSSDEAIAPNATAAAPANNTTRQALFRGGGGGGGTSSSSKDISSKPQSKEAASSAAREPEEPESALALEEIEEKNITGGENATNQSSIDSPMNQTVNSTLPRASGQEKAAEGPAQGQALASSAHEATEESLKATPLDEAEVSSEQDPSEPPSDANATSSQPGPSEESASSAALAAAKSLQPEGNESGSPPALEEGDLVNATARAAEPIASGKAEETLANASSNSSSNASSNANQPPVLEALMPDRPSPQPPGTAVFWRVKATDYEGDKILYKFLLNGREANGWSRIGSWSWLTSDLSPGNYQISALVRDGNHASESSFDHMINASFALIPINQPPALQDLSSDQSSPMESGGSITWTASAIDPDNDTVYYKFLKNGQEAAAWSESPAWSWDTASESAGEYAISVLARDGRHASEDSFDSNMERRFTLNQSNGIPTISNLSADRPGPQPQGARVIWTAAALDPDGDPIYYRFLVDDAAAGEWSATNSWTWDTSAFPPGIHSIKSLVRDGKHAPNSSFDSSKDAAFEISEANQPPILASLLPDAASPQAQGATVTWSAGAADREGDQIFYKFLLNGRDMTGWSASPIWKWSSAGQSLGEHRVRVMVRDGRHAPESSFDDYKESTFTLISEIDLQIENLQKN